MVCPENRACSDPAILALEDQTPQIWPVLEHSLSVVDMFPVAINAMTNASILGSPLVVLQ
jgi:hypothetical protein